MSEFRVAALTATFALLGLPACTSDSDSTLQSKDGTSSSITSDSGELETTDTTSYTSVSDLNEFVVSTTARAEDFDDIDEAGAQIVVAWWYPKTETTYSELADELLDQDLISESLANEWKSDGGRQVSAVDDEIEIVKMWPVRVAEDNATFQISSLVDGAVDETLTFIEFEKLGDTWKAVEVL